MSEAKSRIEASKILDEFVKTTSNCCNCFGKTEEWSSVDVNEAKIELEKASEKVDMNGSKVYVPQDQSEHEIPNEVVLKYIGSLIYENLIDLVSRDGDKVDTGYPLKYFAEIVKYMKNEYDINELNGVEFDEFCRELISLNIPLRNDIFNRFFSQTKEYGIAWKNRCVIVNENEDNTFFNFMKLGNISYNVQKNRYEIIFNTSIQLYNDMLNDFKNYLKNPLEYVKNDKLQRRLNYNVLMHLNIHASNELARHYFEHYTSLYLNMNSNIIKDCYYDDKLREWCGDYKWKLLYRASEHGYTAESFHECCDDKGPTLIIIKSTNGCIFGGYTTQSWSGDCIYYDILNNK